MKKDKLKPVLFSVMKTYDGKKFVTDVVGQFAAQASADKFVVEEGAFDEAVIVIQPTVRDTSLELKIAEKPRKGCPVVDADTNPWNRMCVVGEQKASTGQLRVSGADIKRMNAGCDVNNI